MSETKFNESVVYDEKVNYQAIITQLHRADGLFPGNPWPLGRQFKSSVNQDAKALDGEKITVIEEVTLQNGSVWCRSRINGEFVWIIKDALVGAPETYLYIKKTYFAYIYDTSNFAIYDKLPDSNKLEKNTSRFLNRGNFPHGVVQIIEEAISQNYRFVKVMHESDLFWMDAKYLHNSSEELPLFNIVSDITKLSASNKIVSPLTIHLLGQQEPVNAWGKISVQGGSSAKWKRKNYRIEIFSDIFTNKPLKIDPFGTGFPHSVFSLRSDYTDPTHTRTRTAFSVWKSILKTENIYSHKIKDKHSFGAIDGTPVTLSSNGQELGIYSLMTYLDADSVKLDPKDSKQVMLMSQNGLPKNKKMAFTNAYPSLDRSDFELKSHQSLDDSEMKATVYRLTAFIVNSDLETFRKEALNYFDPLNVIDYFLFAIAVDAFDNMSHNTALFTYDGKHWLFSLFDLDCAFKVAANGYLINPKNPNSEETFDVSYGPLWNKMKRAFPHEILKRWQELRKEILTSKNIIQNFSHAADSIKKGIEIDQHLWKSPSNWFNLSYLKRYLPGHLKACDKYMATLQAKDKYRTYYFINTTLDYNFSGIEHAQLKRLQLFRDHNVKAKILTLDFSYSLHRVLRAYKIEDSSVNLFDYFQDALSYNGHRIKADEITIPEDAVQKNKSSNLTNYYVDQQLKLQIDCWHGGYVHHVRYYEDGVWKSVDTYDVRGFLTRTQELDGQQKIVRTLYFNPDGEEVLSVKGNIFKLKYQNNTYLFDSKEKLNTFFCNELAKKGDVAFIADRMSRVTRHPLFNMSEPACKYLFTHNLVVEDPNDPMKSKPYPLMNEYLENDTKIDGVLFPTDRQRKDVERRWKPKFHLYTVPVGSIPDVQLQAPVIAMKKRQIHKLICVARIHSQKRLEDAIEVVNLIHEKIPDVTLDIHGYVNDQKLNAQLHGQVKRLNLEKVVKFYAYTPRIGPVYDDAQLMLLTSRFEGNPLCVVEALSHGVPVLSYAINYGPDETIDDGKNGFIVKQGNIRQMADDAIKLLKNPSLLQSFSNNAYESREQFSERSAWQTWQPIVTLN